MRTNDKVRKTRFRKLMRESEEDGKLVYDIMGDELGGGEFGDPNTRVLSDVMKENFVRLANKLGVELLHVREDFFDVIPFENNSAYYVDLQKAILDASYAFMRLYEEQEIEMILATSTPPNGTKARLEERANRKN